MSFYLYKIKKNGLEKMFLCIAKNFYINIFEISSIELTNRFLKINSKCNKYYLVKNNSVYYNGIVTKIDLEDLPQYNP